LVQENGGKALLAITTSGAVSPLQEHNPPATNEAILGLRERSRGGRG
jgi:hypothetical protein